MTMVRWWVIVLLLAVAVWSPVEAQSPSVSGAVQASLVSFKSTTTGTASMSGLGVGGFVRVVAGLAQLELHYEQAAMSGTDPKQDIVEGEVLLGIRFLPWLTVKVGPRIRANVTELGTERWVLWQGRIRTDTRLIGSTVRAHVEVWSILSGDVNLNDVFGQGQGLEGGLEVKLFGAFWGGLGYRFDRDVLGDGVRTDVTERLYLRFGMGGF